MARKKWPYYKNYSAGWKTRSQPITYGRTFRTKRGRVGCYIYSNGKRIGFVEKRK